MTNAEIIKTIEDLELILNPFSNDEDIGYAIASLDRAAWFVKLSDIEIKSKETKPELICESGRKAISELDKISSLLEEGRRRKKENGR